MEFAQVLEVLTVAELVRLAGVALVFAATVVTAAATHADRGN